MIVEWFDRPGMDVRCEGLTSFFIVFWVRVCFMKSAKKGFTLVELLVVVAIIGVMVGLLLPAVQSAREASRRSSCSNNLKQLGLGAHNFEATFKYLPPGEWTRASTTASTTRPAWTTVVLQFLEQANKFNLFDFTQDVNTHPNNLAARQQDVAVYLCPSEPSLAQFLQSGLPVGRLNYYGSIGGVADCRILDNRAGIFNGNFSALQLNQTPKGLKMSFVSDGTSHTAMFSEVMRKFVDTSVVNYTTIRASGDISTGTALVDGRNDPGCIAGSTAATRINYIGLQYYRGGINATSLYTHTLPVNWNVNTTIPATQRYNCGDASFRRAHIAASSYHAGGINSCFVDGSVRFITDSIEPDVWYASGTRASAENLRIRE